MADIFLSYSREDEARVRPLVAAFEAQGWGLFWDRRIPTGQTWRSHIGAGLQNARCVVVAWSRHSIESQWVAEEADEGKTRQVLVPVLLDRVQPPRGFREIQAADLSEWQPGEHSERFTELLNDLHRLLDAPTTTKPAALPPQNPPPSADPPSQPARPPQLQRMGWVALLTLAALGIGVLALRPNDNRPKVPQTSQPPVPASSTAATPPSVPTGAWLVVVGSFARAERAAADQHLAAMQRAGMLPVLVDSSQYALLTPSLWVVTLGPFDSRDDANTALAKARSVVPDAYVKKAR